MKRIIETDMVPDPHLLQLGQSHDLRLVGGKAVGLARLLDTGLPVPEGFVVTTAAFRHVRAYGDMPGELVAEIADWYYRWGSPVVAVRSSATAEDLDAASMAGQYKTLLDIQGEAGLLEAIQQCWASIDSQRVHAYLAEHGIDQSEVAMAVIVQRLVPADVAGVLFTANPQTGCREEMLLEASWGLGEAVVSGMVQPDLLVLDRATGRVKTATIADKQVFLASGSQGPRPVPAENRKAACLDSREVDALWRLGLRVSEHFGTPQDIEWSLHGGEVYLLQSRPITSLAEIDARQACIDQARRQLRQWNSEGRGDWIRHNISETLPHPTPLTWSVIRRFMSGEGGFGRMYRMAGFEPAEIACKEGFLELIAGRIYMDLSRAGEMFFANLPYRYDLDLLRSNPEAAQGPPTVPAGSLWRLVWTGRKLAAINRKLAELARDCDRRLRHEILPAFAQYVAAEKQRDLAGLETAEWLDLWRQRQRRVLDEFGAESLLPGLIAGMGLENLRIFLAEHVWDEDPLALAELFCSAGEPDRTLQASQALWELAHGRGTVAEWLGSYGHRAAEEFDLATPRWRERPDVVRAMAARLKEVHSPMDLHEKQKTKAAERLAALKRQLPLPVQRELNERIEMARRYLGFREDGKHYLMLGYDLFRDMVLEAGRRLKIGEAGFLLTLNELHDAMRTGYAPLGLIHERSAARAAEQKLVLPHAIAEADIERLGQPAPSEGGSRLTGTPLSAGVSSGPARIVRAPEDTRELGREYILVCPSTDPGWMPLLVGAAGLVLECGGVLSHGAIVAREMGIPAVVCPGATQILTEGETVIVDGNYGAVLRRDAAKPGDGAQEDPTEVRIPPELVPPLPGRLERRSARLRNLFLLVWGVGLVAAWALPADWLYEPSIKALDLVLWPIVAAWGKPAVVSVLAVGLAAMTMLGQRLLTDCSRLRVAKQRAARLRQIAAVLPAGSPRRQAMLRLARSVHTRLFLAALVPLAVILGPMVLSFLWLPQRVDPASSNPRPGATAYILATVDGEDTKPIMLNYDKELTLDDATHPSQSLPPIRAVLEARLAKWQAASDLSKLPWEVREAGQLVGKNLLADLSEYLQHPIPPQTLCWTLSTPKGQPGRFHIALATDGKTVIETRLVLGDNYPPERKEDLGDAKGPVQVARPADANSPIQLMRVKYSEQKQRNQDVFWAPFAALGWGWDAGWLWTYILAYLPTMLILRRCLRLP
jgi:pyruvate,water dikinase